MMTTLFQDLRFSARMLGEQPGFTLKLQSSIITGVTLLCLWSLASAAQTHATAPEELTTQVDRLFAKWDQANTPGCALGIIRDGKLIYARGYGMANLEHQVPLSTRTVFNLHSISKTFLAMSVALLVRQGKLSFDDDVRKYVPELPDYGAPITIRHLLQHTSGLPDVGNLIQNIGWRVDERLTQEQLLEVIVRQKRLNHRPGEAFSYTNSVMVLLPLVVKRVTGKTLREFMQEQIFAPLGMTHTHYRDEPLTVIRDRAFGYRAQTAGGYEQSRSLTDAVFTTVEDLARWDDNFYTALVGGKESFDWMRTPARLNSGLPIEHGMGLYFIRYRGYDALYHGGDGGDGHTFFAQFPALRFSIILLSNASDANVMNLAIQVMNIFLKKEFEEAEGKAKAATEPPAKPSPPPTVAVPARQLEQFAGTYFSTDGVPLVRRFAVKGGTLVWLRDNGQPRNLLALGAGRFQVEGDTTLYVFSASRGGQSVKLERRVEGERARLFAKVTARDALPLAAYAGRYDSDELDAFVEFAARDGKLFYRWPRQPAWEALEAVFADGFRDAGIFFHFQRNAQGKVTGLSFHQERIWHLSYRRWLPARK